MYYEFQQLLTNYINWKKTTFYIQRGVWKIEPNNEKCDINMHKFNNIDRLITTTKNVSQKGLIILQKCQTFVLINYDHILKSLGVLKPIEKNT